MNVKGVEDCSRLTMIEQRLSALEQAVGIPSAPPVQAAERSGASSKTRVESAAYSGDEEDAAAAPLRRTPRPARRSLPADDPE